MFRTPTIWRHFLAWVVAAAAYQLIWGVAFNVLFLQFNFAGSIYPILIALKQLSELLLYGMLSAWFLLTYQGSHLASRLICGGVFAVAFTLTLWGLGAALVS